MRRQILLMAGLSLMLTGCGGGHNNDLEGGGNNVAYLIGSPHGDMAGVISKNIVMKPYDGYSSNRNILIADPEGRAVAAQYKDGIRKSYEAGRTIMMEDATPKEINNLLEILGLNPSYETGTGAPVALFAVEQIKGNDFYYVVANDDDKDMDDLEKYPEAQKCESSDGSDLMGQTQDGDTRSGEEKAFFGSNQITDTSIQEGRFARFMSWMNDEEGRFAALESDKEAFSKEYLKAGGSVNLKDFAEASSWDEDASVWGQNFRINYTSYSCHSFKNDQDFYAIKQSAVLNPSSKWHKVPTGKNCDTLALQCGHMRRYIFKNYWNSDPMVVSPLRDHSPHNANGVTSLTSGVSFNLSGNVGFKGAEVTGGLSAGVTFSESKTVQVQDVTVYDMSASGKPWEASWKYVFKDPADGKRYCACSELEDAPILSRSNFSPVNQWIWVTSRHFRKPDGKQNFTSEFEWVNGKSDGAGNVFWITKDDATHVDFDSRNVTMKIPLEQPPLLVSSTRQISFKKAGETKDFTIVSAVPWTASCSESWCNIQDSSGDRTETSGEVLHLTVKDNETSANRSAVLTIKSTTTSDVVKIKVFQSTY